MQELWRGLRAALARVNSARSRSARAHRERLAERIKRASEGKPGAPLAIHRRDRDIRVRLYPWIDDDLHELALVRACSAGALASAIVEAVVEVWRKYPFDEDLFLSRCENPYESHGVVSLHVSQRPFHGTVTPWEGFDLRLFGVAVLQCLANGIPADALRAQIGELEQVASEEAEEAEEA